MPAGREMADKTSPQDVSERTMFATETGPLAAPEGQIRAVPTVADGRTPQPALRPDALRAPSFQRPERTRQLVRLLRGFSVAASTEIERGTAFVLIPVFLAVGALWYFSAENEPGMAPLLACALCLAGLVAASRARPAINLALAAALLVVLGALCGKAETMRASTRMLGAEIATQLTGRLVAIEQMPTGRVRMTIDVTGTERPVLRYAPDRVRITARQIPADMEVGSSITGLVRLLPPSGPVRPNSYDFSFQSYFDGIGASGFFLKGPVPAASEAKAGIVDRFQAMVERWRHSIANRIRASVGGAEGEIAAALVVGVRAGIPEDVTEALRRAGIYHIISISGLHMALVAGTIMGMMRIGFALFPGFSSRHPVKKYAAALAILGIAGYLFISGAEVAAERSFIMLAVMLTAVLFDRAALTLRNLAISAILVIAVSPHEVAGPSFQMSFAATAALVGAYAAWADYRLRRPARNRPNRHPAAWLLRKAAIATGGLAMTSLVAGGATSIYAAYHFQQMPSLGLFTNLAAMPIVSTLVMPFAVLGALAMPFGLDGPFFDVMGAGIGATVAIARWFSERSPFDVTGLVPPMAVALLTAALVVATVCTTRLRAASLPLGLAGLLMLAGGSTPDLFVSEDSRLLGLATGEGMAVNRARPSQFTVENWQRAMKESGVIKPVATDATADSHAGEFLRPGDGNESMGFACGEGLCVARHRSGAVIIHAADAASAARACGWGNVIVIADATARDPCRDRRVTVITSRDLARRGSAEIRFAGSGAASPKGPPIVATVDYAIRQPYRPWHGQRRFSREARGMAPYRNARPPKAAPADASAPDDARPAAGRPAPPAQ